MGSASKRLGTGGEGVGTATTREPPFGGSRREPPIASHQRPLCNLGAFASAVGVRGRNGKHRLQKWRCTLTCSPRCISSAVLYVPLNRSSPAPRCHWLAAMILPTLAELDCLPIRKAWRLIRPGRSSFRLQCRNPAVGHCGEICDPVAQHFPRPGTAPIRPSPPHPPPKQKVANSSACQCRAIGVATHVGNVTPLVDSTSWVQVVERVCRTVIAPSPPRRLLLTRDRDWFVRQLQRASPERRRRADGNTERGALTYRTSQSATNNVCDDTIPSSRESVLGAKVDRQVSALLPIFAPGAARRAKILSVYVNRCPRYGNTLRLGLQVRFRIANKPRHNSESKHAILPK